MFGKKSKVTFASLMVSIAFDLDYISLDEALEVDAHLSSPDCATSSVAYLMDHGWLTSTQAEAVLEKLEERDPNAAVLERARLARVRVDSTNTSLERLADVLAARDAQKA